MGNQISKKRKRMKRGAVSITDTSRSSFSDQTKSSSQSDHYFNQSQYNAEQLLELHYLFKHVFQRNLIAPVENVLNVPGAQCLDIGCGPTATWLIDMAAEFPNANFTGIDIQEVNPVANPISPPSALPGQLPSNCQFKRIDVLLDIGLPLASFDHIYQRFMFNVYRMDAFRQSKFLELVDLLKPGGYIELIEPDMIPRQVGPKYSRLASAVSDMITSNKKSLYHGPVIKQCLLDAGLEDVQGDYISIPICWGGYVGKMLYESIVCVVGQLGEVLWPCLELEGDYDEMIYNKFLDSAFDECVEYKTYVNFHWAYGRKSSMANKES
ncbi:S-adenosyl-L-methionine-dependent methyltransferase [Halteromyces radiatus]|uniref:S-adenosyl-L-methionine-dependent methyltransferase n=1 Tax=Halteromyces radiatus TaxID=101107 RepID=UPI002220F131|nr:S-adenosyl-L-methionine-dependent methyltransferase [Halteromyces radiatus]KAI8093519.1 S-adenosyl-L-methionine-dependent methyltransferase [Halteromyces radiatus]